MKQLREHLLRTLQAFGFAALPMHGRERVETRLNLRESSGQPPDGV